MRLQNANLKIEPEHAGKYSKIWSNYGDFDALLRLALEGFYLTLTERVCFKRGFRGESTARYSGTVFFSKYASVYPDGFR